MKIRGAKNSTPPKGLEKVPTGSAGLDEITGGGLPKGRPTLVCGAAGCDKTMLGIAFLAHGALEHNESGVFMAFEENADELAANVASLGIDLGQLMARKKLIVDSVRLERSEIEETGEYDLSGLFIRLGEAIDAIGAKRVVLDTIEVLFAGLTNHGIVRAELRRLFRWLKDKGVTAFITAEQGNGGGLTRYGLEEYVADCVIRLDQRVTDQISTRRLRIVKYRGSAHGTNEYPSSSPRTASRCCRSLPWVWSTRSAPNGSARGRRGSTPCWGARAIIAAAAFWFREELEPARQLWPPPSPPPLSDKGVRLIDVYTGGGKVLTGSARVAQLEHERLQEALDRQQAEAKWAEIRHKRAALNAKIESLKADLMSADQELKHLETASAIRRQEASRARAEMAQSRMADAGRAPRLK